jgi:hypothetical protein
MRNLVAGDEAPAEIGSIEEIFGQVEGGLQAARKVIRGHLASGPAPTGSSTLGQLLAVLQGIA